MQLKKEYLNGEIYYFLPSYLTEYKDNLSLKEAFYQMSNNSSILLDWCINIVSPICQELDSSWCEGEEVSEDMDRSVGYEENNDCISD